MIYPIAFPAKAPSVQRLTLLFRQSAMESPWSLAQQTVDTAAQWQLELAWPRMAHRDAEACAAWLSSLNGQVGTFTYSPRQSVVSTLTGRTLQTAGFAYSKTIKIAGWAAGAASQLRAGQYFQVGTQLLQVVTAPLNADGSGHCTIEFSNPLRRNFTASTPVIFVQPKGIFRLASSEGFGFSLDTDRAPEFGTIIAKEAIT